ncbi:PP2C family protein-serine/threonine phosphatase (plasmid) [Streptomyces sp. CA-294286]|uniref:PP2C family protein-serine/threonine phosphatase n=1 Tax=Streptomyces sp. CA-294286 TaxID=3240070 RepID=UPI003D8DBF0F
MPSRFSGPLLGGPGERTRVSRLRLLPWLLWAITVVVEFATGSDIRLSPVLAVVPPLVAIAHGWRTVVASGVLAWGTQLVFVWLDPTYSAVGSLTRLIAMTGITTAGAIASVARERGEERIRHMRSLAGGVQQAVLRPIPALTGGYQVAGFYQAAESDARVGGDFYEALETPYGLRVVLGDVSGKGLAAVDATVTLLGAFREAAYREEKPEAIAHWMDLALSRRQEATGDRRFATALIVQAGPDGLLRLVNCGHVPPWYVDGDSAHELRLPSGVLLGLFDHFLTDPLPTVSRTLAPGSSLLLVTDGVTEARDDRREFFDLGGALCEQGLGRNPVAVKDAVLTGLGHHTGGRLCDDAAALVLARPDGGRARR